MHATRRTFFYVLGGITLLKLALAAWLPLTGDEAYFFVWGKHPGLGYYDHPPMVGWWLALLLQLGDAEWLLRLPSYVMTSAIAWAIYRLLRDGLGEERALLAGLLYLLAPVNVVNVLISTDTPLILFSFLSVLALRQALQESGYRWFVVAGALLGLAFLSKYFAVLLGLAYGAYLLLVRPSRRNVIGLSLLFLAVLPFAALNVWWNYCHCWDNIVFNVYSRHSGGSIDWGNPLSYLLMLVYLVMPPVLWYGWRRRAALMAALRDRHLFLWLWLLPMLLFFLLSFVARIGLHWVLAFYPLLFLSLPMLLDAVALRRSVYFAAGFSLLHVVFVALLLTLPVDTWNIRPVLRHDLVFGSHPEAFWQQIEPQLDGHALATESYVYSAILEHATGRYFHVFGEASKYGRQDDLLTDYRQLDGKDVAVLIYAEKSLPHHAQFFARHRVQELTVDGVTNYLLLGRGFRYDVYRDVVLRRTQEQFYVLPWFLPSGACYFYDRYFPDEDVKRLPRG
jgi:4-amino-4-deoxy-L-arabinose transferase and related glycosyltransferases of PMT family